MKPNPKRRLVAAFRPQLAAAVVSLLVLSGCAIGADDSPRDIDRSTDQDPTPAVDAGGAAAIGAGRIFLLAPEVTGLPTRLEAVARDVPEDVDAVLEALFAGPNAAELTSQVRTALPAKLKLEDSLLRAGGVLAIDLSAELLTLSGDGLVAALAQIVFTVSGLSAVDSVKITVDNNDVQWPSSSGELTASPLTIYDYPGWDPSSQPAFPGIPGKVTGIDGKDSTAGTDAT